MESVPASMMMEAVLVLSPGRFLPGGFVVYVVCSLRVNLQSVVSLMRALSWAWATRVRAQQQEAQVRHGQTPLPFAHVLAPRHGQTSPPFAHVVAPVFVWCLSCPMLGFEAATWKVL